MQCPQIANHLALTLDGGTLAGMETGFLCRYKAEGVQTAGSTQHGFHIGFKVIEIHLVLAVGPGFRQTQPGQHSGQHGFLLKVFQLADKTQAAFKQAHTGLLAVQVVCQRLEQTRQQ